MVQRKVFISYHHDFDQEEKNRFATQFGGVFIDRSVRDGDIPEGLKTQSIRQKIRDKWLKDSTVTIVLIGRKTWSRKHVDWEIGSSLRDTDNSSRSGLLGILLPSYMRANRNRINRSTLPPRLVDNLDGVHPYAKLYHYPSSGWDLMNWIEGACLRRNQQPSPNISRTFFGKNRHTEYWTE